MSTDRLLCPACGALAGVPLVPGFPNAEKTAAYERGDIMYGGCVVYYETHGCRACGSRWIDSEDPSADERPMKGARRGRPPEPPSR